MCTWENRSDENPELGRQVCVFLLSWWFPPYSSSHARIFANTHQWFNIMMWGTAPDSSLHSISSFLQLKRFDIAPVCITLFWGYMCELFSLQARDLMELSCYDSHHHQSSSKIRSLTRTWGNHILPFTPLPSMASLLVFEVCCCSNC